MIFDDDDDSDESYEVKLNGSECFYIENWMGREPPKIKSLVPWLDPENVPLRVGICGAHGNDKTRLAHRLARKLDIPVITNVVRTGHDMGLSINKRGDLASQMTFWLGQLYEQLQVGEFVSDLTLIDILSYTKWLVEHNDLGSTSTLLTALGNVTKDLVNHEYSVVFYVPILSAPEKDGTRSVDKKFQAAIDENISYFLEAFDVEYIPLLGNLTRRFDLAFNYLMSSGLTQDEDS